MRVPGNKKIEGVFKNAYNRTRIGKALHRLQNTNRRNAVFIWIPKNAGTSIYRALNPYGCLQAKNVDRIKYRFSQSGLVTFAHMDYFQLVQQGLVSQAFDETAIKFCFSRNPYDRAVSLYVYLSHCTNTQTSFLNFWRNIVQNGVPPIDVRNETILDTSICNAQLRWVERLDIDFIGSFESLEKDFERLVGRLGLPNLRLNQFNASHRKPITDYYCRESKHIIEDLFYEDFVHFDYEYESHESLCADEGVAPK